MRAREIHDPLADDGVVESFHELRKVLDGKRGRNFAAILALGQNLPEQLQRTFLALPHIRRTHGIHRPGENHGLPQRTVRFRVTRQLLIQPAQTLRRGSLAGKLFSQVLGDAGKSSPPDFPQNRVLARKITEESRLADFEGLHDIVNARLLVPPLAEQPNRGIDDFLTETRLLAFPQAERFSAAGRIPPRLDCVQRGSKAPPRRRPSPGSWITCSGLRASHNALFSPTDE